MIVVCIGLGFISSVESKILAEQACKLGDQFACDIKISFENALSSHFDNIKPIAFVLYLKLKEFVKINRV